MLSVCLCLALALYEDDIEVNYGDSFYNEITEEETPAPTTTTAPCASPDMTKWDKMFSMLENSQMRETMLLQYADDVIKVEMDSLRQEMLRFVTEYGGSCGSAMDSAGRRLALQLEGRFKEMFDRLKPQDDPKLKSAAIQMEAILQQLLSAAQSQASRLVKLETSCFTGPGSGVHSKTGFQHSTQHQEQEVASQEGALEAALMAIQQSREDLQEVLKSLKQRYLPGGCDMALLFPMHSRRIYTAVIPEVPLSLSAFTVCLWVKPTIVSNKTVLFSYGTRQNPYEIQLLLSRGSALFTVGGETHLVEAHRVVNPGGPSEWVHLCGAWSSQQGIATLWADGKRVAITPGVAEGHVIPDGGSLQLGQERNGCCPLTPSGGRGVPGFEGSFDPKIAFAGKMTGVNVWDRVLSEEEISRLGLQDGQGCEHQGNMVAWGVTEMVPHGGAQFIH